MTPELHRPNYFVYNRGMSFATDSFETNDSNEIVVHGFHSISSARNHVEECSMLADETAYVITDRLPPEITQHRHDIIQHEPT